MNFWQKMWADPKTTVPGIIAAALSIGTALHLIPAAAADPLQTALTTSFGGILALLGIFSNWPKE